MNLQDCIETVEKILLQNKREHKNIHDKMLYERGYLTGVLASIMMTEPRIRHEISKRVKTKK